MNAVKTQLLIGGGAEGWTAVQISTAVTLPHPPPESELRLHRQTQNCSAQISMRSMGWPLVYLIYRLYISDEVL